MSAYRIYALENAELLRTLITDAIGWHVDDFDCGPLFPSNGAYQNGEPIGVPNSPGIRSVYNRDWPREQQLSLMP